MTTETVDQFAERMVRNEVLCCLSSLVATLATGYGDPIRGRDLSELAEQAFELACPVPDYESAAREAGWTIETIGEGLDRETVFIHAETRDIDDRSSPLINFGWQALCEDHDIEPHQSEVYEHWAVSTWFAEKLAEHGEKVDTDFASLNVWARQCTGQGIADSVALKIARECMAPVERVDLCNDPEA